MTPKMVRFVLSSSANKMRARVKTRILIAGEYSLPG